MLKSFKSLADMQTAFPDEGACINHFRALRWPESDKITCPWCGVIGAHYTLEEQHPQVPGLPEEVQRPAWDDI